VTRFRRWTASRRKRVAAVLLAMIAGVLGAGYIVASALAAPAAPVTSSASIHRAHHVARPAAPVIVTHPANPTRVRTATFTFTDTSWPVTFRCALDTVTTRRCTPYAISDPDLSGKPRHRSEGEQRYTDLAYGPHCFYVYATNAAGHAGPTTVFCWSILPPPGRFPFPHHHRTENFTVGGDLPTPLYPGISEPDDLTFTNPNASPIAIASGAISGSNITITTNRAGCSASNFAVVQGLTASVTVPAHQLTPISLSDLLVPEGDWPVIEMLDTSTNQDACEGATLTLTYSGIEATG
jgi:hypothetical protein